jgi:hypothetical protein
MGRCELAVRQGLRARRTLADGVRPSGAEIEWALGIGLVGQFQMGPVVLVGVHVQRRMAVQHHNRSRYKDWSSMRGWDMVTYSAMKSSTMAMAFSGERLKPEVYRSSLLNRRKKRVVGQPVDSTD